MSAHKYSSVMEPLIGTKDRTALAGGSEEGTTKPGLKVPVGVCQRGGWQGWYMPCWDEGSRRKGAPPGQLESGFMEGRAGG